MRRWILWALVLALLCGCSAPAQPTPAPVQPFRFYYRASQVRFDSDQGLIVPLTVDLGQNAVSEQELLERYLRGPGQEDLLLPCPKATRLQSVERSGFTITVNLTREYAGLTGVDGSIADACLAMTLLQLEGIRAVRIRAMGDADTVLRDNTLSENDLLLFDSGEESGNTELTLYFADSEGKYLLAEKRSIPYTEPQQLPEQVVELMIAGPQSVGMYPTLPQGTDLLDINVENGVCAVDFNGDFYNNRPQEERAEQLTLMSVVNSLCQVEGVDQVQFYVEGRRLRTYTYLDISGPYVADSAAVGPIRSDIGELDVTLCLCAAGESLLHRLPVRIRAGSGTAGEEALLLALVSYPSQNGLVNPLFGASPSAVNVSDGLCTVDFSDLSFVGASYNDQLAAVRSLVGTMVCLPNINRVQITVEGQQAVLPSLGKLGVLSPGEDWYACQ